MRNSILGFVMILVGIMNISYSQISIVGTQFSSFNVSPETMTRVSVLSQHSEAQVVMYASIKNSSNEVLLSIQSQPFMLSQGLNVLSSARVQVMSFMYGTSNIAQKIMNSRVLPSGTYQYCCAIVGISVEGGDEYCDEIESEFLTNMYLISPDDNDTIEMLNPLLLWAHTEAFNMLSSGEYFRMVIVEKQGNQDASQAIMSNTPIFVRNNLNTHSLLYPIDAPVLERGKQYSWQVQKLQNGVVKNTTEAWTFNVRKPEEKREVKVYAVLKKKLDGSIVEISNKMLRFRFTEDFVGGNLKCKIYNSRNEQMLPTVKNSESGLVSEKRMGHNYFEIDLEELSGISSGLYLLVVETEKRELYYLSFYVH